MWARNSLLSGRNHWGSLVKEFLSNSLGQCHASIWVSNSCFNCSKASRVTWAEHLVGLVQYIFLFLWLDQSTEPIHFRIHIIRGIYLDLLVQILKVDCSWFGVKISEKMDEITEEAGVNIFSQGDVMFMWSGWHTWWRRWWWGWRRVYCLLLLNPLCGHQVSSL